MNSYTIGVIARTARMDGPKLTRRVTLDVIANCIIKVLIDRVRQSFIF